MGTLFSVDSTVFVAINQTLANPVTDALMPIITNDNVLRIGYAIVAALLLWKGGTRVRWAVITSALVIALSDQLTSAALKPLFARVRPCHDTVMAGVHLLVGCGGGKSFPSSHAANAFSVCVFYPVALAGRTWPRRLTLALMALAATVALSRVFVGVHYPGDVLGGAVLGALCGAGVGALFSFAWRRVTYSHDPGARP